MGAPKKAFDRCNRHVVPLAVETYGRWGKHALQWFRAQAKHVAGQDPALAHMGKWATPALLSRWWSATSIALQRANVAALRSCGGWPVPRYKPGAPAAPPAWQLLCEEPASW